MMDTRQLTCIEVLRTALEVALCALLYPGIPFCDFSNYMEVTEPSQTMQSNEDISLLRTGATNLYRSQKVLRIVSGVLWGCVQIANYINVLRIALRAALSSVACAELFSHFATWK